MAVMDEFKKEREAIKHGTPVQKLQYVWDYYKVPIIAVIVLIIVGIAVAYTASTRKEQVLNGILLNVLTVTDDDPAAGLVREFTEEQQIDPSGYEVCINAGMTYLPNSEADAVTNYEVGQMLMTYFVSETLDFITGDLETMTTLAYSEFFADLSEVLTEEQIAKYEPYFLYMDRKLLNELITSPENYDLTELVFPDCTEPEGMEEPIPVFIDLSQCQKLLEIYGYTVDTLVFGISVNAPNREMTLRFVDFLMSVGA